MIQPALTAAKTDCYNICTLRLISNFYNMKYRKNGHAEGVFFNSFIDHADYLYFDELYNF